MDSQLASVLTSGSLDVQNGSQCGEESGPVTEDFLDPKDHSSASTVPGSPLPCPVKAAVTIRQDTLSINGKKPEGGGTSEPASQETSKSGGFRQPITVKTGVPVLHSQPIRIKIVVPPRCKRPIPQSAISLTKDFAHTHLRGPLEVITEKSRHKLHLCEVTNEGEIMEVTYQKTEEEDKSELLHEAEAERGHSMCKERDVLDVKIIHIDGSDVSNTNTVKILSQQGIKEETAESEIEKNIPLILQEIEACRRFEMEQQTEPLDLSLPKKRDSRERRYGRFLDDSGCESSLIMEVDEYEGEGDRDIVEEDEDSDTLQDSLLSPSFFSTSVLTSLSSLECDTENLLLIDDQGIPYTLSPDGLKVPQINASTSEDPQSDQTSSAEAEGTGSSHMAALAEPSQSSDNALHAPSDGSPSLSVDQTKAPEVFTNLITNPDPPVAAEPNIQAAQEADTGSSGISVPSQPIQILTNSSTSTPVFLLSSSSSSSSAPVGLSLPLSVSQTSAGASTPMFLLLSSVPSSSCDSTSTSTPIAVLDPTTGQLSQITATSTPVSLPLSSGQVSTLGSPLPTLSHPVIRLSPSNPPVILSGVNNVNSGSVLAPLAIPGSTLSLQDEHHDTAPLIQTQISYSESKPESEAISAEEASNENNKPLTLTASSPQASLTYDLLAQPTSEAEAHSPASDSKFDPSDLHSEHLPLDDHLYFSNTAAPPSPPMGPIFSSGKLDSLDPLDPLSPVASPKSLSSRRVLYCQLCPRVFFYLSDLERHAITHSQKKPHVCQQCGKAFKRSSHLQRHKHIHTGQRNFVCPICAKRFREAGELQRHQRVHTGEKPYQCQLCHTRFAERNTLRRHTKRKHPYHQVAMEMLNERRDRGGGGSGRGDEGGGSGMQEEQESAEWYSSTVSTLDNSDSEMET